MPRGRDKAEKTGEEHDLPQTGDEVNPVENTPVENTPDERATVLGENSDSLEINQEASEEGAGQEVKTFRLKKNPETSPLLSGVIVGGKEFTDGSVVTADEYEQIRAVKDDSGKQHYHKGEEV